jgi:hypothetical protein
MAPFVTDPAERERLAAIITDIVASLTEPAGDDLDALCDVAMLRAYVADVIPDDDDVTGAALSRAVSLLARGEHGIGLYGGASRVAWAVAHMSDGELAEQVCGAVDARLRVALAEPWTADYDLASGLVGLGVYALERGEAGRDIATRVLEQLEALARPRGGGIAWLTPPDHLPRWQLRSAPEGYWNLGIAHGVAGVIGLCARCLVAEVDAPRARRLLDGAVAFLLAAEPPGVPRYPAWYADGVPPLPPARLAWCYGDLGVAIALLAAATACGHAGWRAEALALARGAATRSLPDSLVTDAGLCHGAFGAAHLFHRLHRATGDEELATATRTWLDRGIALRNTAPLAGFPAWDGMSRAWTADPRMLTGAAGVALALHALISEVEPLWDRLLLADM